jgi:SAM-dependent methyltransferase
MDRQTLAAYDAGAVGFAKDWHDQPPPADLHVLVRRFFRVGGRTADIGCGSGREVAFLASNGFDAIGYDASDALLDQARARYPKLSFQPACLPELAGFHDGSFDNVLCETVIMHLPRGQIAPAVHRLLQVLKPGGILYLSWRVTDGTDLRDPVGRLYTAFDGELVRKALGGAARAGERSERPAREPLVAAPDPRVAIAPLGGAALLLDDEPVSLSSAKKIHRIVARKDR